MGFQRKAKEKAVCGPLEKEGVSATGWVCSQLCVSYIFPQGQTSYDAEMSPDILLKKKKKISATDQGFKCDWYVSVAGKRKDI